MNTSVDQNLEWVGLQKEIRMNVHREDREKEVEKVLTLFKYLIPLFFWSLTQILSLTSIRQSRIIIINVLFHKLIWFIYNETPSTRNYKYFNYNIFQNMQLAVWWIQVRNPSQWVDRHKLFCYCLFYLKPMPGNHRN